MSQSQAGETTRLLEPTQPQYVFGRYERKKRLKQFQCCLCAIFLLVIVAALMVAITYSIINSSEDNATNTTDLPETTTPEIPLDSLIMLFSKNHWPINDRNIKNHTCMNNTKDNELLEKSFELGKNALIKKDQIEEEVPSLQVNSPSFRHQKVMSTSKKALNMSRHGYQEEYATRHFFRNKTNKDIKEKFCVNNNNTLFTHCTLTNLITTTCNIYHKYRSYNGSCNNLKYATYGLAYQPFRRALPPDYADGISKPRMAKNGKHLPSARTVSLEVHRPYYRNDPKFSVMLAVWGQFLDHDITATALSQKADGSSISCCHGGNNTTSPECFPVILDHFDPFSEYNLTCMEFVRSAPAPTCCLGPREQLNQVTPFIDASVVYGVDESKVNSIRSFENGQLKMLVTNDDRTLLPISDDLNDGCNRAEEQKLGRYCFNTGDSRSNENLHLTAMHLLWARHHNMVASNLSKLNPNWDDETVFQEARRILSAQMQHITYTEFLPIILGDHIMKKFDMYPQKHGYFKKYNASINPNIANNFATAAFRFAHTLIPGLMKLLAKDSSSPEFIQMHKMLFDPFLLYEPEKLDNTLRGAMSTSIEASDSYFTNELKSHLFERISETVKQPKLCGLDLVSLNIQRGRDHGLPGYVFWREHCGLKKPQNFDDLKHDMDKEPLRNIKTIYKNVEDIDLYTGALSEKPVEGSIIGPTITCLILDQYIRLKFGDRFWYETPEKPYGFSIEQLNEIRKISLAAIICDNSDNVDNIQPYVMKRYSSGNENKNVPCFKIPRTNLTHWKDNLNVLKMPNDSFAVVYNKT